MELYKVFYTTKLLALTNQNKLGHSRLELTVRESKLDMDNKSMSTARGRFHSHFLKGKSTLKGDKIIFSSHTFSTCRLCHK